MYNAQVKAKFMFAIHTYDHLQIINLGRHYTNGTTVESSLRDQIHNRSHWFKKQYSKKLSLYALPLHHSPLDLSITSVVLSMFPVLWSLGSIQPQNAETPQLPLNTNSPPSLPIIITPTKTQIPWPDPNLTPTNRAIQNPHKPRINTFHMKQVTTSRQFPTKLSFLKSL